MYIATAAKILPLPYFLWLCSFCHDPIVAKAAEFRLLT